MATPLFRRSGRGGLRLGIMSNPVAQSGFFDALPDNLGLRYLSLKAGRLRAVRPGAVPTTELLTPALGRFKLRVPSAAPAVRLRDNGTRIFYPMDDSVPVVIGPTLLNAVREISPGTANSCETDPINTLGAKGILATAYYDGVGGGLSPTLTDNLGNTYTGKEVGTIIIADWGAYRTGIKTWFFPLPLVSAAHTFTATLANSNPTLIVYALGSSGSSLAVDQVAQVTDTGTPYSAGPITPSEADTMAFSFCFYWDSSGQQPLTPGVGWSKSFADHVGGYFWDGNSAVLDKPASGAPLECAWTAGGPIGAAHLRILNIKVVP